MNKALVPHKTCNEARTVSNIMKRENGRLGSKTTSHGITGVVVCKINDYPMGLNRGPLPAWSVKANFDPKDT